MKQNLVEILSLILLLFLLPHPAICAQSLGNAGTVEGTVTDPSGAVISGASIDLQNSLTGFKRTAVTDNMGNFRIANIPPNPYHLHVAAIGFKEIHQDVRVRSSVPVTLKISLELGTLTLQVDVEAGASGMVENVPSTHTDVDQTLMNQLPLSSPGAGLSDAITLSAPGVVADSNGFFHPLGDHAQTSMSIDNQPISDQQSKAFSTQLPPNAIQSMEVITGAVPAEYGDKTSLVVNAITRSGLGQSKPKGSFLGQYGSFGTSNVEGDLALGGVKAGNFIAFNFTDSGRFLDTPEFAVLHGLGNSVNLFDRIDYNPTAKDSIHFNLFLARNRFDTPNSYDQQAFGQDQGQLVRTINIAPGWVHTFNSNTLLAVNPYYRLDQVWYYPSANPFSDQPETFGQQRRLNNTGIHADVSHVKGIHNFKFGLQYSHTFLTENIQFGITDPNFNNPSSPNFQPGLLPYDLTRGGSYYIFHGHTDIKQEAFFAQDTLTLHDWTIYLGLRFDNYNGISSGNALQPRIGISYHIKPTNTVLRGSYIRTFETPYNENLIFSSQTGAGGLSDGSLGPTSADPLRPGTRNQFNVGVQQGIGKWLILDGDYFWKYTHNAYDFSVLLDTSVAFPISWNESKVDGVAVRINMANYKGLSAFMSAGHTRARFFPPETGGLFFNSELPTGVFRIDHDQAFQQTTHINYQPPYWKKREPFISFTWRYDSGVVAGNVPDYDTALGLTADQQAQIGLYCGNTFATLSQGLTQCSNPVRGALRLNIPADGTENADHNPPRITPRHLYDLSVGSNNLLGTEKIRVVLRLTAINLANKEALYNFLSTFSGTHFVSPRALQAQLGVVF
ncbi:MAG: TonB-dependent receptor [Terriglobia bacterium]